MAIRKHNSSHEWNSGGLCRATKWPGVQGALARCCRGKRGCRGLQRRLQPPTPHSLPTQAGQAAGGGLPPRCRFISSASTASRLHRSSGTELRGRPLIPPGSAFVAAHPSSGLSASPVIICPRISLLFIYFFSNPRESSVLVSVPAVRVWNPITSVSALNAFSLMFNLLPVFFFLLVDDL